MTRIILHTVKPRQPKVRWERVKLGLDDGKDFERPSYAKAFRRKRTRAPARELSHPSIVEHRIDERYIP